LLANLFAYKLKIKIMVTIEIILNKNIYI